MLCPQHGRGNSREVLADDDGGSLGSPRSRRVLGIGHKREFPWPGVFNAVEAGDFRVGRTVFQTHVESRSNGRKFHGCGMGYRVNRTPVECRACCGSDSSEGFASEEQASGFLLHVHTQRCAVRNRSAGGGQCNVEASSWSAGHNREVRRSRGTSAWTRIRYYHRVLTRTGYIARRKGNLYLRGALQRTIVQSSVVGHSRGTQEI